MKKHLIVLSLAGIFIICTAEIVSENGRAGYTNSPGETNCTNCHSSFPLNTGGGSIRVTSNIPNWIYTPGQTYTINCIVKKTGTPLFGFGLEILKNSDNSGTLIITNPSKTQIKTKTVGTVVRNNVVHTMNGGLSNDSAVFSFNWTAPSTNKGNLKIWFAGIAANGTGGESGDYVYTKSQTLYAPLLTVTPTALNPFTATLSVPSAAQSFTITGSHLIDSVRITPRSEYQVSLTGTSGWMKKIALAKNASHALPLTTIYVRYKPTSAGVDSGYVTCSSASANSKKVKVTGTSTPRLASQDQQAETADILLYPNPVSDVLSVLNVVPSEKLNVSIYDLSGKMIRSQDYYPGDNVSMDVSQLKNGLYMCRIESGNEVKSLKFIKQ